MPLQRRMQALGHHSSLTSQNLEQIIERIRSTLHFCDTSARLLEFASDVGTPFLEALRTQSLQLRLQTLNTHAAIVVGSLERLCTCTPTLDVLQ
ncbi:hypothetical protein AQ729_12695 [Burkholderia pseudomallei]|nr:hypothetical protein BOC36_14280 [Burkholderia pseudomallei]ARL23349.1 hypothetical protein BOC47_13870 [Burkholderia pseudomallei]KEO70614.1 hypothetical protein J103_02855 [Burkholderia pseudomallei MSHR5855]OMQ73442.1 hypothetical protein AQ713_04170 [Burkholderia pseudomallei]OMR69106.1 hypothetical protein AQ729_12695 [Burkholderia pseudomallei]